MQRIINTYLKYQDYSKYLVLGKNLLFVFGFSFTMLGFSPLLEGRISEIQADEPSPISASEEIIPQLLISGDNALIPSASPNNPEPDVVWKIGVVVTAYSSSVWETDEDPFTTAAGTQVRDGIIANNYLPFGSKIRIPELFGDKIFVVEDRMSWQKGNYHFDVWFPDYWQALSFGAKRTYIEVLEG